MASVKTTVVVRRGWPHFASSTGVAL